MRPINEMAKSRKFPFDGDQDTPKSIHNVRKAKSSCHYVHGGQKREPNILSLLMLLAVFYYFVSKEMNKLCTNGIEYKSITFQKFINSHVISECRELCSGPTLITLQYL